MSLSNNSSGQVNAFADDGEVDPQYRQMRAAATDAAQRGLDETLSEHRLDAIVAPTNNPAWKTTLGTGDASLLLISSGSAAVSGYALSLIHISEPTRPY